MCMSKRVRGNVCLILCGVLVWFLADAGQLRLEAAKALALCAGTVIPALFPFMAVTGLLMRLGFGQWLAPYMAGLMAPLFRLPGCAGSALLLGLVGGYPIGARTAAELYTSGALTRQEAERLLTFCNNSNPVFLISVLGVGVFGSVRVGLWLWLIHVASALVTGLLFRGLGRGRRSVPPPVSFQAPSLPGAFVASVKDAAGAMVSVCAFVTLFYVLVSPLARLGGRLAAMAVGVSITLWAALLPMLHMDQIMIGDIMLLIPGMAMTNAVRDTMVGSPISGVMRLIETLLWAGALAMGFMTGFWLMGRFGL